MVYQIEMAIETLQKSEGLSSQRSSLLNSHVSCFYKCLPSLYPLAVLPFSFLCTIEFGVVLAVFVAAFKLLFI